MPTPTAITVLNSAFWNELGALYNEDEHTELGNLIQDKGAILAAYSSMTYGELEFFDWLEGMPTADIAAIAYLDIGLAFYKVYKALTAEYDPLENYFTNRTFNENGKGSNTKTGSITTIPSGTTSTKTSGDRERSYTNHGSTHMGTTYDKSGDNDFANISKDVTDGTVKDTFTNYGTTTSFNAYQVQQNYNEVKDAADNEKHGGEKRSGSSGIFSKQDLTQREIELRLKNRIFPILVRMVVDVLNAGVWRS